MVPTALLALLIALPSNLVVGQHESFSFEEDIAVQAHSSRVALVAAIVITTTTSLLIIAIIIILCFDQSDWKMQKRLAAIQQPKGPSKLVKVKETKSSSVSGKKSQKPCKGFDSTSKLQEAKKCGR